jgi:hypothetical protein
MSQKRINRSFQPPVDRQLTLTEEVSDRLLLFTGVEITVEDPDSVSQVIWGDGIELVNLDRILPDQIILLPNEEPRRVQDKNLEFLMDADCSVLQVLNVYVGNESYSFSFKVLGQLHADNDPVFDPQQRLFVKIRCGPLMLQMLTVVPISDLAESFRHLGSLDPNKRRRIENSSTGNVLQVANGMLGGLDVTGQLGSSSSINYMIENSNSVMNSSIGGTGQFGSSSIMGTSPGLSFRNIGPVPSSSDVDGTGSLSLSSSSASAAVQGTAVNTSPSDGTSLLVANVKADDSLKIGKRFTDLDGRVWQSLRTKTKSAGFNDIIGLLRLLDMERINELIPDLNFSMAGWVQKLEIASLRMIPDSSSLKSVRRLPTIQNVVANQCLELLEPFVKGEFSASDWTKLTLSSFLFENVEMNCFCEASAGGRRLLMEALGNFQTMCEVHFHPVFADVMEPLINLFRSNNEKLSSYHDIYLKCKIDFMLFSIFTDIKCRHVSSCFPALKMSSPEECYVLMRSYVQQLISMILSEDPGNTQPHSKWYAKEGESRFVKVDPSTYQKMGWNRRSFPLNVVKTSKTQMASNVTRGSFGGYSQTRSTEERKQGKPIICLWNVAEQLGLSVRSGMARCNRGCPSHPPLGEISFIKLKETCVKVRMAESLKAFFVEEFTKNQGRFME